MIYLLLSSCRTQENIQPEGEKNLTLTSTGSRINCLSFTLMHLTLKEGKDIIGYRESSMTGCCPHQNSPLCLKLQYLASLLCYWSSQ